MKSLDTKTGRLVDLIAEDPDAAPAYRRVVAQMEQERVTVTEAIEEAERASKTADVVAAWTAVDVQRMLGTLSETLATDLEEGRVRELRGTLADLIERVEYDPETRQAVIRYRLTGVKVASPRRFELRSPP